MIPVYYDYLINGRVKKVKGKNRVIYLCAALFALIVIGGLLCTTPALAWETWPTADNNDPNHIWTVVFDQAMNIATINDENIYVSDDITGSSRVSGVSVSASDNTHALVAPPTGGWSADTSYYLIITQKVLTQAGMPLKDEVRMPFRIVVETRETPVIDVINNGSNITVKVNGNQLTCDQPPYIANGSTMVPFRAIAEALEEDDFQYNLDSIKWKEGCFSRTDSVEALVSIYDINQCHASGYSEIWLLRYDYDWVLDRKIADWDSVSFMVVDIENDGKQEVWYTGVGGNQGCFKMEGKLLSINPDTQTVLYSNKGFDNSGAYPFYKEAKAVCKHDIDFQDIDNDGILEIIDRETKEYYSTIDGSYVKTSSVINKSTYKMVNGYYLQISN